MKLRFLGGVDTVTGSRHLIETATSRVLIDCGMYQGVKALRRRNWAPFPERPESIDAIVLTHAHIDHTGYLPLLVKRGFKGKIHCTQSTLELCRVLLPDAGHLQEEDARYANRKHFSRHEKAEPLFTVKDALRALELFEAHPFDKPFSPVNEVDVSFSPAGHILGSACVRLSHGGKSIIFSGDVGRQNDPVMLPPVPLQSADYLVLESTYGNRVHSTVDPEEALAEVINQTLAKGGIVLMPAFAVGRAQLLLYLIHELQKQKRIPDVPVFLNSPMAITATEVFLRHHNEHRLDANQCHEIDAGTTYVRTVEDAIELTARRLPAIIISASGMASGGRVLHHLKALLPNHRNSVVFAGYQAPGTRGDAMVNGVDKVKIHGEYFPVKAMIYNLDSLSAHGDYEEILTWLKQSSLQPRKVFITHGETRASDAMRKHVEERLGWDAEVPELYSEVEL
ncbi:MAG: MBL fold metallo-hydrolase [Alteromonadaceae bacterium]|nr:MBL fold metallo-hydrolase [Alteromonadaceae bacterium]